MDNDELTTVLTESQSTITKLVTALKSIRPLAEFGQAVMGDGKEYSIKEAADILAEKTREWAGKDIGRNKLFEALRSMGVLSSNESNYNEPYRQFIDAGYFKTKLKNTPVGIKAVSLVTGKGLEYLFKKLKEYL